MKIDLALFKASAVTICMEIAGLRSSRPKEWGVQKIQSFILILLIGIGASGLTVASAICLNRRAAKPRHCGVGPEVGAKSRYLHRIRGLGLCLPAAWLAGIRALSVRTCRPNVAWRDQLWRRRCYLRRVRQGNEA